MLSGQSVLGRRGKIDAKIDSLSSEAKDDLSPLNSLEIRSGLRPKWNTTVIVGHLLSVATTELTISDGLPVNSINLLTFPASAAIMAFASDDANDTSAGTGLRTILIVYLDANYDEQEETITLNGTTKVVSVASMLRINYMIGQTAGSGGINAGNIYVGLNSDTFTAGAPDTAIFHTLGAGLVLSSCGVFTVPRKRRLYFQAIDYASTASGTKVANFKIYLTNSNISPLRLVYSNDVVSQGSFFLTVDYNAFWEEKTDMEITCITSSGTQEVQAFFGFYIENTE